MSSRKDYVRKNQNRNNDDDDDDADIDDEVIDVDAINDNTNSNNSNNNRWGDHREYQRRTLRQYESTDDDGMDEYEGNSYTGLRQKKEEDDPAADEEQEMDHDDDDDVEHNNNNDTTLEETNNDHDHEEEDNDTNTDRHSTRVFNLLVEQIYQMAAESGFDVRTTGNHNNNNFICVTKANNILEATTGDIHLAAQLYWDDFIATHEMTSTNRCAGGGGTNNNHHNNHHHHLQLQPPSVHVAVGAVDADATVAEGFPNQPDLLPPPLHPPVPYAAVASGSSSSFAPHQQEGLEIRRDRKNRSSNVASFLQQQQQQLQHCPPSNQFSSDSHDEVLNIPTKTTESKSVVWNHLMEALATSNENGSSTENNPNMDDYGDHTGIGGSSSSAAPFAQSSNSKGSNEAADPAGRASLFDNSSNHHFQKKRHRGSKDTKRTRKRRSSTSTRLNQDTNNAGKSSSSSSSSSSSESSVSSECCSSETNSVTSFTSVDKKRSGGGGGGTKKTYRPRPAKYGHHINRLMDKMKNPPNINVQEDLLQYGFPFYNLQHHPDNNHNNNNNNNNMDANENARQGAAAMDLNQMMNPGYENNFNRHNQNNDDLANVRAAAIAEVGESVLAAAAVGAAGDNNNNNNVHHFNDFLFGDVNNNNNNNLPNVGGDNAGGGGVPAAADHVVVVANNNNQNVPLESVSVSDDEAAGAGSRRSLSFKMKKMNPKKQLVQMPDNNQNKLTNDYYLTATDGPQTKDKEDKTMSNHNLDLFADDLDEGYLSDNDWLWESLVNGGSSPSPPSQPTDILWGGISSSDLISANSINVFSSPHDATTPTKGVVPCSDDEQLDKMNKKSDSLNNKRNQQSTSQKKKKKMNSRKRKSGGGVVPIGERINNADGGALIVVDDDQNDAVKGNNVVVDDGGNVVDNAPDTNRGTDDPVVNIPFTWLNAGFQFSETEFCLVIKPPCEDDLGYNAWKASDLWRGNARNKIPPPYHCRAITALVSIVNGLLYTGVNLPPTGKICCDNPNMSLPSIFIPGSSNTTPVTNKPLVEVAQELEELEKEQKLKSEQEKLYGRKNPKLEKLREEARKDRLQQAKPSRRDLENRLVDALTSLLVVAVRASSERKRKVLDASLYAKDTNLYQKCEKLKSKLSLCPTCWYNSDNVISFRDQTTLGTQSLFNVSYNSITNIRAYVLCNINAFMSSGGCALFLETIIRIHGRGAILRMIKNATNKNKCKMATTPATATVAAAGTNDTCNKSETTDHNKTSTTGSTTTKGHMCAKLIFCQCEQKHREHLEANPQLIRQRGGGQNIDTTPQSHECMSVELISLLLTGRVYSSFEGWTSSLLGLGILSNTKAGSLPEPISIGLTRPDKPVWILRGPTCYTSMWLNGCNDNEEQFSIIDKNTNGTVALLTHWNCWYGIRRKTKFRLVTNRDSGNNASSKNLTTFGGSKNENKLLTTTGGVLPNSSSSTSTGSRSRCETIDPGTISTEDEMNCIEINQEDQKFYPGKYRLWRYRMKKRIGNQKVASLKQVTMGSEQEQEEQEHFNSSERNIDKENQKQEHQFMDIDKDNRHTDGHDTTNMIQPWKAYYGCNEREKLIIDTKLGPQINTILWTRWPYATIDKFIPDFEDHNNNSQQAQPPIV